MDMEHQQRTFHPVGSGEYVVEQGQCMASIAYAEGHYWRSLWERAENSELKRIRKDPNVLYPGDRVAVPEIRLGGESRATEQKHRFRRKGVQSRLRLEVRIFGKPVARTEYCLNIQDRAEPYRGETDDKGRLEVFIPPNAAKGTLHVCTPVERVYSLSIGTLNPIESMSGAKARLNNLGYLAGPVENEGCTQDLCRAVLKFQQDQIEVDAMKEGDDTGELDAPTRQLLLSPHPRS